MGNDDESNPTRDKPRVGETRRRFLSATGVSLTLGLAGCSDGDGSGSDDGTPEDTEAMDDDGPTDEEDTATAADEGDEGEDEGTETDEEAEDEEGEEGEEGEEDEEEVQIDPAYTGWPMVDQNVQNTRYRPDESGPRSVTEQWEHPLGGRRGSIPTVVDGLVYFATGSLQAVNAASGEQVWERETENVISYDTCVVGGTVYAHDTTNVLAFDAETGEMQWQKEIGEGTIVGTDDSIYVQSGELDTVSLYSLDAETGDEEWRFEPIDEDQVGEDTFGARSNSWPAVVDGTVFVPDRGGSNLGGGILYAVDADTGEAIWERRETNAGAPVVDDGTLFVSNSDTGQLEALEAATGDLQWAVGISTSSRLAVADDTVVAGSDDGVVHALAAGSGDEEWTYDTGQDETAGKPAVSDDTVVIGAGESLYGIDLETGDGLWEEELFNSVEGSPTVANGTVFVPHSDSAVHVFAEE